MRRLKLSPLFLLVALLLNPAARAAVAEEPVIRVGVLSGKRQVEVDVSEGRLAVRPVGESTRLPVSAPLRFAIRSAPPAEESAGATWDVEVHAETSRKRASRIAQALSSSTGSSFRVEDQDGSSVVFAGPFDAKSEALAVTERLHQAGMTAASLVEIPPPPSAAASRLVVVDEHWLAHPVLGERAWLDAGKDGQIEVAGTSYRGQVEISISASGSLTVVNAVPVSQYIRGVVPKELGPEVFPALEALAAQAVAARTWVMTQFGKHQADGYDVCPTAHCQVYGGASAEHPLSDEAVAMTATKVLAWQGAPAFAYFSSTCGGHTEAVENVFEHEPLPYLRGVSCYPRTLALTHVSGEKLETQWTLAAGGPGGAVLGRLMALGVLTRSEARADGFTRRAKASEAAEWVRRALATRGRFAVDGSLKSFKVDTAMEMLSSFQAALGWEGRRSLLAQQDIAAASRFSELAGLSGTDLEVAYHAMKGGLLPEGLSAGWAKGKMYRGHVLEVVDLWLASQGAYDAAPWRFLSESDGVLTLYRGKEHREVSLPSDVLLYSGRKGVQPRARESLEVKLGDKLVLMPAEAESPLLVTLLEDPDGAAFDRLSSYSWWERHIPFADLKRRAKERVGFSGLTDVLLTNVSKTGRVIGIELKGAGGRTRKVERFAARGILGLPDARATLSFERDERGKLLAVRAVGRGWGHGVGLCQVGAFGMALRGADHRSILEHYYPEAQLTDYRGLTIDRP